MRRRCKILFLALSLASAFPVSAQPDGADSLAITDTAIVGYLEESDMEPHRIIAYNQAAPDAAQWQKLSSDKAYAYRDKREYVPTPPKPRETPLWMKVISAILDFLLSPLGVTLMWIGLALVVGYILFRLLIGSGRRLFSRRDLSPPPPESDGGAVSEEGLLQSDWERKLHEALSSGDTRLAVRYSYMHLLQAMQARGLILYRPDKTNTAYVRELTDSLQGPFRTVSRQYEYAWYGHFLPGAEAFERYMQHYNGLKKSIASS